MKFILGAIMGIFIGLGISGYLGVIKDDTKMIMSQLNVNVKNELRLFKTLHPHQFFIPYTQLLVTVRSDGTGVIKVVEEAYAQRGRETTE